MADTAAVVYGVPAGVGGLGAQSLAAITDVAAAGYRVEAVGPGPAASAPDVPADRVGWHSAPGMVPRWATRYTWLRWWHGRRQYLADTRLGRWARDRIREAKPAVVYAFTQVGLEALEWAAATGMPRVLESPNGHIRNFRAVYDRETRRWGGRVYPGHPSPGMVARVEREYALADVIRVSSDWAKRSMVEYGIPADRVVVVPQRPRPTRFAPPAKRLPPEGPLRVCFVGTLDLRKGFAYLLRAARRFGPDRITLRLVGGTVDRFTARLLARERVGLDVRVTPGDPLPALHEAELFALPTLEDGSPFVVPEAMAAGVPLVVTDQCGNHPLVRPGETGWVVPAADEAALAEVLGEAYRRRGRLADMGGAARADWERLRETVPPDSLAGVLDRVRRPG